MGDRKLLNKFSWRMPTDEEKERLAYAEKRNKVASFVLLGIVIVMFLVPVIYYEQVFFMVQNNIVGAVAAAVLYAALLIFLIMRIHLVSRYKVADVVVDEIVMNSSTDNGNYITATVSQGDAVITGVTIAMKEHPEAGAKVLLYIENNDTWSVGIV